MTLETDFGQDIYDGNPDLMARFLTKFEIQPNGCWQWRGTQAHRGYGYFAIGRQNYYAHRVAHWLFIGLIPKGKEIDHLCSNRGCVNPNHIEAVTHRENLLRSDGPSGLHARQTHCKRGHEFTPENTIKVKPRGRNCRTCKNDLARERARQRRAA